MDISPVIEINNVYLKSDRRNQIFKNLDFKLMQGRSAVVYGPPGSGKSSLINLLLGLQKPSSGSV
ncbi:MAG: ATP-binding cassette domain-containing protein, partial [candidate division Zixibacteria bacterium]|nr:ATP-binding cassette domain-containing protein [candidate division Zixibacteria bacterium]